MAGSIYKSRSDFQNQLFNDFFGNDPFGEQLFKWNPFEELSQTKLSHLLKDDPNVYSYSEREYTDGNGNVVKEVNDNGKKTVKKIPAAKHPNWLIPARCNNKLPSLLAGGNDFPQADAYIDENKSEVIEINCAGIAPDRIKISYKDENLTVSISADEAKNEKRAYFLKGIKDTSGSYEKYFYIDPARFDIRGLKKSLKDGILTLTIPKSDRVVAGIMEFGDDGWKDVVQHEDKLELEDSKE